MRAFRGYTAGLIAAVSATVLGAFLLNTTVNPWRVTPMPWSSQDLEPYRDIASQIRTAKAGLVRSTPHVDAAIVGSSRVANAMDPEYEGWAGQSVLNLGCSGGFIYESTALARYLMEQREVGVVILGVDPGDLSSTTDTRPLGDFHGSPLAGDKDHFNRELRYYIGISTLEASVETLKRAADRQPTQYTPKGLRTRGKANATPAVKRSQLGFLKSRIQGEAEFDVKPDADAEVRKEKARVLEDVMRLARTRGTRLIVYFHPLHALHFARASHAEDPPVILARERRALLDMATRVNAEPSSGPPVEVWDFAGYHPLNCDPLPPDAEARMRNWADLEHYSLEVGNLIQSRMMGWPLPMAGAEDFGVKLTGENIDAWFARVREDYRAYLTGPRSADVALKEEWIREGEAKR